MRKGRKDAFRIIEESRVLTDEDIKRRFYFVRPSCRKGCKKRLTRYMKYRVKNLKTD